MSATPSRPSAEIVVTGVGAVSGAGWGAGPLWDLLLSGETAVGRPRRFDVAGHRTALASEVPEPPAAAARRLTRAARFAVAAAREALEQAGDEPPGSGGVFFGSSTGGMVEGEAFVRRLFADRGAYRGLRHLAAHQMNAPGDAVARDLGWSGPVRTLSSACSSGAMAIAEALDALRQGEVDVAVAGGSDTLCDLTYAGFNALRAVDPRPCQPFRAERAGLSLGEGAAALVLERAEGARRRGARPLAALLGAGSSCDAYHMTAPDPAGAGAALAVRRALDDAGLEPGAVAFINAHGTGTPHNDRSEAAAIAEVFGERAAAIPVTSSKGAVGHLLGAAGAIEAVATVLGLVCERVPPTAGAGPPDPEIPLDLVIGEARRLDAGAVALSTSFAFGGANAALVLGPAGDGRAP